MLTTNLKIILQEKSSQGDNAMLSSSFDKNINNKKLFVEKQTKKRRL